MQNYTVIIGMNGAGLTNAIYRAPGAVAIQLSPRRGSNQPQFNIEEFASLLRAATAPSE